MSDAAEAAVTLRFAVLEHDHPFLHWDLLLERGASLRTFRLHEPPEAGRMYPAEKLPDHRLSYLDYEGPVSQNRGTVSRWDAGTYAWRKDSDDVVEVALSGRRFRGRIRLTRGDPKGDASDNPLWLAECS